MPTRIPGNLGGYFLQRKEWPPSRPLDRDGQPQLPLNWCTLKIDAAVVEHWLCGSPLCVHLIFPIPSAILIYREGNWGSEFESLSKVSWLMRGQPGIQTWLSLPLKSKFLTTILYGYPNIKYDLAQSFPQGEGEEEEDGLNDFSWNAGTSKLWKEKKDVCS